MFYSSKSFFLVAGLLINWTGVEQAGVDRAVHVHRYYFFIKISRKLERVVREFEHISCFKFGRHFVVVHNFIRAKIFKNVKRIYEISVSNKAIFNDEAQAVDFGRLRNSEENLLADHLDI